MLQKTLAVTFVAMTLAISGCCYKPNCFGTARSTTPCCPPGTAPATIPGPPPVPPGYSPVGSIPAYYRR